MRTCHALSPELARRTPWRNGRGITEELAISPASACFEASDFEWRISRAAIAESGSFSCFAGFDRLLVILDGGGIRIDHGDSAPRTRLRPLEPYHFRGIWQTRAELVDGPVRDFNVLYRPERVHADVEPLRIGRRRARLAIESPTAFLHLVAGSLRARLTGEEEPFDLAAGWSLSLSDLLPTDELDLQGQAEDTLALLVRIADCD